MTTFVVAEMRVGRARPFGLRGQPSAIDKQRVLGPITAEGAGLAGDEQGDRRHHGGPDKAIHAYPVAHYPLWRKDIPEAADRFGPGAFGENLVVECVTEADICLGDRWRLGTALLARGASPAGS